ncbi:MAG: multidrug effflux MFS transporter, partial [Deltaproteobacteria bacterium]|nr:multidrug effflux MFS transporter [Deltaproteobacteria bacterium]
MVPERLPRWPSEVGSRRWIISLAALTAMVALSIDMSLPAQPALASQFDVDAEDAQLTLSLFMIGFAGAQIFVGYLSDAWGRRRVILGGLTLFVIAGIACTASPSIEVLIAFRVLQGFGAAAAPVVARAMVRDTQPATQAAAILSTMLAGLAVAPMIAPMIGGALLRVLDWRAIFATLAITGLAMLVLANTTLTETLPVARRTIRPSLRGLFASYAKFLATPGTKLPALVFCVVFAGQFAYIADSPFVLMGGFGVSGNEYGLYFASTAVALMLGSMTGGRMLRAGRPPRVMIVIGAAIVAIGGALLGIGTQLDLGIAAFLGPMMIYFFGSGIVAPSATALAMEPAPEIAGTASAAIGCAVMI